MWILPRSDFLEVVGTQADNQNVQKLAQLDGVRLFDALTLSQKLELMRGLQIRYYSQDQMIVRQGETGSEFFIIVQGQV